MNKRLCASSRSFRLRVIVKCICHSQRVKNVLPHEFHQCLSDEKGEDMADGNVTLIVVLPLLAKVARRREVLHLLDNLICRSIAQ